MKADFILDPKNDQPVTVVRVSTSCYKTSSGIHQRRSLLWQKRKSKGFAILDEDTDQIGCDEVFSHIVNLAECEDGLYTVVTCNEKRDWESGMVEEYDYKLIKFEEAA